MISKTRCEKDSSLPCSDSYLWYAIMADRWEQNVKKVDIISELGCTMRTLNQTLQSLGFNTQGASIEESRKKEYCKLHSRSLLGAKKNWRRTLEIIRDLLEGQKHSDLSRNYEVTRAAISYICAKAKHVGFDIPWEYFAVLKGREQLTFYRASLMLKNGKEVSEVTQKLGIRADLVEELNSLVQEIFVRETKG